MEHECGKLRSYLVIKRAVNIQAITKTGTYINTHLIFILLSQLL